jgi:hypothetical protein
MEGVRGLGRLGGRRVNFSRVEDVADSRQPGLEYDGEIIDHRRDLGTNKSFPISTLSSTHTLAASVL